MKRILIVAFLMAIAAFAEAQTVVTFDPFDTTGVANGKDIGKNGATPGRRKWLNVFGSHGIGGYLQIVNNNALMSYSTNASAFCADMWDSVVTTPSRLELTIDSLGATAGDPSFYIYSLVPNTADFTLWNCYRVKWIHSGTLGTDQINLERSFSGNSTNTQLGSAITRTLQRLDKIRMYEYGGGWRAFTIVRAGATLDSMAVFDTVYTASSWKWGLREWWNGGTTATMHMDSMYISTVPTPVARDTIPPAIVSLTASPSSPDSSQALTFTLHATDNYGLGVLTERFGKAEVGTFTDSVVVNCGLTKDTTIVMTIAKQAIGNYIYNATAKDDTGLTATSATSTVAVHGIQLSSYQLYDNFNAAPSANIADTRQKWKAMSSQPESTGVGFMINNDSTASPTNTLGTAGTLGGVYIDTVRTGRSVVGFIVKGKGGNNMAIALFQRMSDTSWTKGNGYKLNIVNYGGTTGDQFRILEWTGGIETQMIADKLIEIQVGDTIYFKSENTTNRLTGLVVGNGRRDSLEAFGVTRNPSSYRVWMRGDAITPWKIDNVYFDTIPPPPPLPVTLVDTIPPVNYSQGLLFATDTTCVLRSRDEQSNAQYSSIPSNGLDSMGFAIVNFPANTLFYQLGKKITTARDTFITSASLHPAPGNYRVYSFSKDKAGNTKRDTSLISISSTAQYWLTTYFSTWQLQPPTAGYWCIQPWKFDFTGLTHVIAGGNDNVVTTPPYLTIYNGGADSLNWAFGDGKNVNIAYRDSIVKYAHAKGVQVLQQIVGVGGGAGSALNTICQDSAATDALCIRLAQFVQDHRFDGVDINWETNLGTAAQTGRLFRRMRAALSNITTGLGRRAVIHISPTSGAWGSYSPADANANVDQINPQEYDLSDIWNANIGANGMWYVNPLFLGTGNPPDYRSYDTRGPLQWIAAGFNRKIMGVGMANMGRIYIGSSVLYGAHPGGRQDVVKYANVANMKSLGYAESYDAQRHAHAISGTATANYSFRGATITAGQQFWYTYQDPRDIPDQVQWVKDNNLGGIMLYDMTGDLENTAAPGLTNPLINTFISALGNSTVVPAPATPVPLAISGDPNNQPVMPVHLFWSFPANSQTFNFLMATDSTFNTNVQINAVGMIDSNIWVGQVPYPVLSYGTRYYWKVQAVNSSGTSAYSARQTFKTISDPGLPHNVPPAPVLVSPSNGATGQPTVVTLRVQKSAAADTVNAFHIRVATDAAFTNLTADDTLVGFVAGQIYGEKVLPNLSQGGPYYWKARAKNVLGWSAYSSTFTFTTAAQATISPFKQGFEITWDPARKSGFALEPPRRKVMAYTDPATWTKPDSGQVAEYSTGFWDANDPVPVNYKSLSGGGGAMTYTQIMNELNKASETATPYWYFNGGLTVNYSGLNLARFDATGSYLTSLSVSGPATFSGGVTTFGSGINAPIISSDATQANPIQIGASSLIFVDGVPHVISVAPAATGNGQPMGIVGQQGAPNARGGDAYVQGAPGNVSGNGGDVLLIPGAAGTGVGSSPGKAKLNGVLQYIDGNQGAGKVLTSDSAGNASWQRQVADSSRKIPSAKDFYSFTEDWDVVGTATFNVATSFTSNTFGRRWIAIPTASGSGNILTVDQAAVSVFDSSDAGIVRDSISSGANTAGTARLVCMTPMGVGSTVVPSIYLRKSGLIMDVKFMMPLTTGGMDSMGQIWGFANANGTAEDFSVTNTAGAYMYYANKLAAGSQDSIYCAVASGSGKTKRGIIKPTSSQEITSTLYVNASGYHFIVNGIEVIIPWSDANVPAATQFGVPIKNTLQYAVVATSNKTFRQYYFHYSFPTSR